MTRKGTPLLNWGKNDNIENNRNVALETTQLLAENKLKPNNKGLYFLFDEGYQKVSIKLILANRFMSLIINAADILGVRQSAKTPENIQSKSELYM